MVRHSGLRLNKSLLFIQSIPFVSICRKFSQTHFSRQHKLPLNHLILSIFNRKGATLAMELRRFFKSLHPKAADSISTPGYHKQRLKLNPEAFMVLSDFHVQNFYAEETDLETFKDHFVLAIDGSYLNLPNTRENMGIYGFQENQAAQQVQAGVSCLYDVLNKMILNLTINDRKFSERGQVEVHLTKIKKFIQDRPYILVLDRGYPSSFFFLERLRQNQKFVVRLSSSDFRKEQLNMASADENVVIEFTQARINPYRHTPFAKRLRETGFIKLRFVKIALPDGKMEFLATNLSKDDFSSQDIGELYHLRWGIETAYDTLKNKFLLENFTGKKAILIEQDILATVCLYNMMQDMLRDAEIEQREKNKDKHHKYRMKINVNMAIGIVKDDLIKMALETDPGKRAEMFEGVIKAIADNIIPVRENRQFERENKHPAIKHPFSKKHSF